MSFYPIVVGSRRSPLAQVQVKEVLEALNSFHPEASFAPIFVHSTGDIDQKTSLRALDKTDFFTKEIDAMLVAGDCRIGIHSAKDLPEPLPKGLTCVALTQGLDPSDSLVLRQGATLETLPHAAVIATSSARREEAVLQLRSDFKFIDIRGTIAQRLSRLETGEADGVVVAEAALIRLGLTDLNRVKVPGETTKYQGQLAIIAREDDIEMATLFRCLDSRPHILYTGLELPNSYFLQRVTHCPLITTVPLEANIPCNYTDVVFTSKTSVKLYFENHFKDSSPINFYAVGQATAAKIRSYGHTPKGVAVNETAEGVVTMLSEQDLARPNVRLLWPHAAKARPVIADWLKQKNISHDTCVLYDTLTRQMDMKLNLDDFDEIVFTSPSTVDAFLEIFGKLPNNKKLTSIGPITQEKIESCLDIQVCST